MTQAKSGDTVKVHYTGTLQDGTQFDSSRGGEPLEFQLGAGQLIPGFENAVAGMNVGDTKTVTIPAEEAYGPHRPEMVQKFPRQDIPDSIELAPGITLMAQDPEGNTVRLTVVEFDDDTVTMDANHPLAGKDLTFELELVAIG